jgi:hypothetical protein
MNDESNKTEPETVAVSLMAGRLFGRDAAFNREPKPLS